MSLSAKVASYGLIYTLCSIEFGFTLNFSGLPIEDLKKQYPDWDYHKDERLISYFSNFASLFGAIGGFAIRLLFHFISGRKCLFTFHLINSVIWLLYFLLTPELLYVGIILRSIQGIIVGGSASLTPIMMTNLSPEDTVGMVGCLNQFGIVLGMIIFSVVGTFASFQMLATIAAIVGATFCGLVCIVPDDRTEKEKRETIFQRKNALNIVIGILLMVFQQFCGINAILDHLTDIMSNTGIYINENLQSALAQSSQLVSVFIALFNMDGIGRRKMWGISSCFLLLSQMLYIICLNMKNAGWFQASSVFLYLLSFGQGQGPIPWFICHDLFAKGDRLDGQMLITFGNMICSFGVTYLFPFLKKNMDEYIIMIIFMCITLISLPFGMYFIPRKLDWSDENLTLI
ncbi:glucose import [Tritrichomonas musculus]|uniref:Glucose import n=1 Tax=Tritrichomonas musculus TaxID=1915356 RepID=A0ABR2GS33_9EUKA